MRNNTIAVIADKETGVVKSLEIEIITSRTIKEQIIWECKESMRKMINKRRYKILTINVYLYD